MIDSFISGVLTLVVLFLMFCGAVLLVEAVPVIGWIGMAMLALVTVSAVFGFVNRK